MIKCLCDECDKEIYNDTGVIQSRDDFYLYTYSINIKKQPLLRMGYVYYEELCEDCLQTRLVNAITPPSHVHTGILNTKLLNSWLLIHSSLGMITVGSELEKALRYLEKCLGILKRGK